MKKSTPDRDAPMVDSQGKITPAWLEYFKDLDQRAFREKVSLSAASTANDGKPIRYVSSTGFWTPSTF